MRRQQGSSVNRMRGSQRSMPRRISGLPRRFGLIEDGVIGGMNLRRGGFVEMHRWGDDLVGEFEEVLGEIHV